MKNLFTLYKTATLICTMSVMVCACDDILEEEPQNKLKPSTFSDYDELLNRGYPDAIDYYDEVNLDYYTEMMTDDATLEFYNANLPYPIIPFSFASTHEDPSMRGGYDQAWKYWYQAIYYANVVIDNIADASGNADQKNYLKGEAKALRAFAYFKLINLYAPPYDENSASQDLGVPLKLDPTVTAESYSRNSVQEVYDQIDADLNEGIELMSENDQRVTSKFKLTPLSARLLASRVALYKKDYETTISRATEVIDTRPMLYDLSGYAFEAAQAWGYGGMTHVFNDANQDVLFKYGTNEFYYYFYYPGALALSDDLISIYEPGDIRLYYYSYPKSGHRVYYKYRPFPNRTSDPIRGFRVEEAFLNRAEAYAETGQLQKALDDINTIRRYKFDSNYQPGNYYEEDLSDFSGQDEVIDAVRTERRRELMFEFHRWYDLRRYGMPEIVHHFEDTTYVLSQGDLRYTLQIPQQELNYNPTMKKNPRVEE